MDVKYKPKKLGEDPRHVHNQIKAHYFKPKLVAQSPFLESKSSDFKKKHLNGVEIHIFFHFQVHTTII
jgi:hypothetical protein